MHVDQFGRKCMLHIQTEQMDQFAIYHLQLLLDKRASRFVAELQLENDVQAQKARFANLYSEHDIWRKAEEQMRDVNWR